MNLSSNNHTAKTLINRDETSFKGLLDISANYTSYCSVSTQLNI